MQGVPKLYVLCAPRDVGLGFNKESFQVIIVAMAAPKRM